ncbi:MAG: SDR family NAD(P)-dependent oxidoreductase, partial [Caulobacteraceae bacterium]|nr:SDR family NAD(P)-dependent oxidoreductase [Caulobacteraceae bacterium]
MNLAGAGVVVTGGGGGLGAALCRAFAAKGARVVVADLDGARAGAVAREVGGLAIQADVGREADVQALVREAVAHLGAIDLFYSNAGVGGAKDVFAPDAEWDLAWRVNLISNVYAVRHALPA